MVGLVNLSTEPSRHKIHTLKEILNNGEVFILGLAEVNSNWRKVTLKKIYTIGQMVCIKHAE